MFHSGRIIRKFAASPTIVVLDLEIPTLSKFEPGQWLDFMVPPNKWIGGFSIVSCPKDLPNVTIAVKRSNHPPAEWVHQQSSVGALVEIQVGGSCTLPDTAEKHQAVFCAGGIGISPILCQYREYIRRRDAAAYGKARTYFYYSVKSQDELVFEDELFELTSRNRDLDRLTVTLTKQTEWKGLTNTDDLPNVEFRTGRFLQPFLDMMPLSAVYYICGPRLMLDHAVSQLKNRGVPQEHIRYELWW